MVKIDTLFQTKLFQKPYSLAPHTYRGILPPPTPGSITITVNVICFSIFRYQDTHNQSFIMVVASGRWLGVRLDLLNELFIGAVAVMAILMSQDAGT